jgi:hypothetical protein
VRRVSLSAFAAAVALACGLCGCASEHMAVVDAKGKTLRIPAPAGMISDFGIREGADSVWRASVPANGKMLAHFSAEEPKLLGQQAVAEVARSLPEDRESSHLLYAEIQRTMHTRMARISAEARPAARASGRLLATRQPGVGDSAMDIEPREQAPVLLARNDERGVVYFTLVGMPEYVDGGIRVRPMLVGTTITVLKDRVIYLYLMLNLPRKGDPLGEIVPALTRWTDRVRERNR